MHKQILMNWLDSIAIDWPISRRRYYGTEIPIWYCKSCSEPHVPEPGKYYQTMERSMSNANSCDKMWIRQNLLEKKEPLIHGWILAYLHYSCNKIST